MDRGGVGVVQPYITTVGDISEDRRVVDLAASCGVLVCPCNWFTGVLGAATVHLAAYSPITPYYAHAPVEVYWSPLRKAIAKVGLPIVNGAVALPAQPGIGVELPEELIARFQVA